MFIAHLPAGYLVGKHLTSLQSNEIKNILNLAILGSILPDFDLFYFYLIDNKETLHHDYWIHIPFYWTIIYFVSIFIAQTLKNRKIIPHINAFHLGILSHLVLDTFVGKINWLYPFSDQSFAFFEVPAKYDFWVLNFVLHWSFIPEIIIIALATIKFFQTKNSKVEIRPEQI